MVRIYFKYEGYSGSCTLPLPLLSYSNSQRGLNEWWDVCLPRRGSGFLGSSSTCCSSHTFKQGIGIDGKQQPWCVVAEAWMLCTRLISAACVDLQRRCTCLGVGTAHRTWPTSGPTVCRKTSGPASLEIQRRRWEGTNAWESQGCAVYGGDLTNECQKRLSERYNLNCDLFVSIYFLYANPYWK